MTDIDHLKAMVPISSVVGRAVKLRRAGRQFVGLCPFHGEKNPSFYVSDEVAAYFCHGCGATGDVIRFVMDHEGVGFREATDIILGEAQLGFHTSPELSKPSKACDNVRWAKEIWQSARSIEGTIAEGYLARRGIGLGHLPVVDALRFSWLRCNGLPGEHPALIAAFTNLRGDVTSIQRIFLTKDGRKISAEHPEIDAKQCLGSSAGGAVKFGANLNRIILTESVEDGLSLSLSAPEQTVWAVAGAGKIPKVELPPACTTVIIAPDNDPAGMKAIADARPIFMNQGKAVAELIPSSPFRDWNEQHIAEISA